MPGVPAEAIMGFASNGSQNGDTALTPSRIDFHEVGYFGVEAGPSGIPAPNSNTTEPNNWYRLHNDPRVRSMLGGRSATMTPWPTSGQSASIPVDDQIAIGLANISDDIERMRNAVPSSIRPSSASSLWAVAIGFMGWSAGTGGATAHLRRYAEQLASVPEDQRWVALLRLVAADPTSAASGSNHRSPAHTVNRTQQKLRVGRGLSAATGGPTAWFQVDDGAEDAIARRLDGQDLTYRLVLNPTTFALVPTAIVFVSMLVAGAIAWRRARGGP